MDFKLNEMQVKGSRPDLALETDNGRCLCDKCHKLRHS